MKVFEKKYGHWALVTGASSGIGEEFAKQLAAKGLNLVLASRRKEKLEIIAGNLEKQFNIEIKTVRVDFSEPDATDLLLEATENLEIGLVIPNAGADTHGAFLKYPIRRQSELVHLNCIAPMEIAHHFGQKMIERGRGGIIFLSSTFGYQAVPLMANYAATKAYILSLGEALHVEYKKKNVDVTVLSPGMTNTSMQENMAVDFSKMPMKAMDTAPVVETALEALGKKPVVIPGGMNKMMMFMSKRIMSRRGISSMFGGMLEKAMDPKML